MGANSQTYTRCDTITGMNIIGHKNILTFFEKATLAQKLHHAYLFVGRSELGKRTVAEYLARQQFGNAEKSLATNPDFFVLARGKDDKTGKTKKNISIEQIHTLRHFLQGKPFLHKKKIAVIDDAELLSRGAMNALLKTLEEPKGNTIVYLIATEEKALLETIVSRCQTIYFHPVLTTEIESYLVSENIDAHLAVRMAEDSLGLPGKAVLWRTDDDVYARYAKEVDRCEQLFGQPLHKQLKIVDDLFEKKDDHIATRALLVDILNTWEHVLRKKYTQQSSADMKSYDIVQIYNAIERAKIGLVQNIHPRMLVEQILLSLTAV